MPSHSRQSPSGKTNGLKGIMAIASTAVALTAAATATGTFAGARTGDAVTISPRANLNASLAIAFARVVDLNTIVVGFSNVGASTNTGAITVDVGLRQGDND